MSRKDFPIEGKRIRGHRRLLGSAPTRRLRPQSCELRSTCSYVLDDLAAAEPAPSAPRPAVARHA